MSQQRHLRVWIINGLVAALYLVLSIVPGVFNLANGMIQFRLSEALNHLIVFNKKYIWGVVIGVLIFDAIPQFGGNLLNVVFGGGQSLIFLWLSTMIMPKLKKTWQKMALTTGMMTISMCLIALMLHITAQLPFWYTYLTTAISELVIMAITAPIMYYVDKVVHFNHQIEK